MKELETYSFAGLKGTDYTFLCTTDMSQKLDKIFGFNYISQIVKNGIHSEHEIYLTKLILDVKQEPVRGLLEEIIIPISNEVECNIKSAKLFLIGSHESEKVANFFSTRAMQVGFFFALPYNEIISSNTSNLSTSDIERAIEEGYARIGITKRYTGTPIQMLELTHKFCPVEKRKSKYNIITQK